MNLILKIFIHIKHITQCSKLLVVQQFFYHQNFIEHCLSCHSVITSIIFTFLNPVGITGKVIGIIFVLAIPIKSILHSILRNKQIRNVMWNVWNVSHWRSSSTIELLYHNQGSVPVYCASATSGTGYHWTHVRLCMNFFSRCLPLSTSKRLSNVTINSKISSA